MKKILILAVALVVSSATANAQFGNFIRKAAEKATEKAVDKAVDHAEKSAEKAMDRGLEEADKAIDRGLDNAYGKKRDNTSNRNASKQGDQDVTYASLMMQALDIPTEQQLIDYKGYELNEQSFKMITSPVARYVTNVALLSTQVLSLSYSNIDSTEATDMAYDMASRYSGLSRQEIERLSTMSEAEQEAYLKARYANGTAEAAVLDDAAELGKLLEPLQPTIDRWEAAGSKADQYLSDADEKCRSIYSKYATSLSSATGKERNTILLKYYTQICKVQREAVVLAMKVRIEEQLPIAEQLELSMSKIRKEHKNYISHLLNYSMLTATQCMGDAAHLTEVPEY